MFRTISVSVLALMIAACTVGDQASDGDLTGEEDISDPTVDYERLVELFPECADDLQGCLADPELVDELIEAGVVALPDGLSAAGSVWRIISYGCKTSRTADRKMSSWCRAAGGTPGSLSASRSCRRNVWRKHILICSKL